MKNNPIILAAVAILCFASCHSNDAPPEQKAFESGYPKGSFGYDLDFLRQNDSVVVLNTKDGLSQIIISPKYQAKVFTSTDSGVNGKSFGWINYKTFDQARKSLDPHMNAFGGEDRLWLGPEGGKFSIFFRPRTEMKFKYWHTPVAFDFEPWTLTMKSDNQVSLSKSTRVLNYLGHIFSLNVVRDIQILEPAEEKRMLGVNFTGKVKTVAFTTKNTIINTCPFSWSQRIGAPCLWDLDMFTPSPGAVIVVPYDSLGPGKKATTDYFGKIPPDRLKYVNGVILFKADGKMRGKIGIPPFRAKNVAGSYDGTNNVLTIIQFDLHPKSTYLNQEWRTDRDPFSGDAVNAYNDGPLADKTQMGPFFELESVSPAAFLKPQEGMSHTHSVFHFTGDKAELNNIATKVLGISLQDIQAAFK